MTTKTLSKIMSGVFIGWTLKVFILASVAVGFPTQLNLLPWNLSVDGLFLEPCYLAADEQLGRSDHDDHNCRNSFNGKDYCTINDNSVLEMSSSYVTPFLQWDPSILPYHCNNRAALIDDLGWCGDRDLQLGSYHG